MAGSRVTDVVNAAVDALVADATLIGASWLNGAKVYTHVPMDTDPPYVVVLGGDELPWAESFDASGDDAARQVDVNVRAVSAYRGTKQVDGLANLIMTRLTTASTWSGVTGFSACLFVRNAAPTITEINGALWFERLVTVRVYVN